MNRSNPDRWTGILGLVSCALFAAFVAVTVTVTEPGSGAARSEWRSYYLDSGNQDKLQIGLFLIGAATFFFLPFLAGLRARLRRAHPDSWLPTAALGGGIGFMLFMLAGAAVNSAVATAANYFDHYQVNIDVGQTLSSLSYPLISYAGVAGGVLVGAASLVALKSRMLPKWVAIAGCVVAVAGFVSFLTYGVSNGLELIWVLAVSLVLVAGKTAPARIDTSEPATA